ncbi:MAG: hypothetical protein AB7O26_11655 [Planctomycetaceae bacterium]
MTLLNVTGCGESTSRQAVPPKSERKAKIQEIERAVPPPQPDDKSKSQLADSKPVGTLSDETPDSAPARKAPVPEPIFRPSDQRVKPDVNLLERNGIRTFESKRLRLHTDIEPQIAESLPKFIDAVYDAWVSYFGPLPPDRERSEYQLTGYIMKDRELFIRLNVLPDDLPQFLHGRHRGAEFWLNDQEFDYYRRHLMIHEATHCFMTAMPNVQAPAWYMEGMAEMFGTHRVEPDGSISFRVMPEEHEAFGGLGRIEMIRADVASGRLLSLTEVDRLRPEEFVENSRYGWAWGLCQFLDSHPRYRDRFRTLGKHTIGREFETKQTELFRDDLADLSTEWALFAAELQPGFDFERAAIEFRDGAPLALGVNKRIEVATDRGWQSSGVLVEKGKTYDFTASGEFTLADEPVPWTSTPDGISIFYSEGRPIGRLLASIRASISHNDAPADAAQQQAESMRETIPVGRHARFAAPVTGTVYFRVNDFWRSLADNKKSVTVEVREIAPTGK